MRRRRTQLVGKRLLVLGLALLAACGEPPAREIETVVVCVWDSVDVERPEFVPAKPFDRPAFAPPAIDQLRGRDGLGSYFRPRTRSASGAFASLLTRSSIEEHGLRSVTELGGERISADLPTLAEELRAQGWRTLASVSEAHFGLSGLDRGFDVWRAPEVRDARRWRAASEVVAAIESDLDAALASEDPVFLVLYFGDLRDGRWKASAPPADRLEPWMRAWRHGDELVDGAFDGEDEESSVAERLRRALLRRTDDPRREALLNGLYAGTLAQLDGLFADILARVDESRSWERRTAILCGGPAGDTPADGEPGPRRMAPYLREGMWFELDGLFEGWRDEPPRVDGGPPEPLSVVASDQGLGLSATAANLDGLRVHVKAFDTSVRDWGVRDGEELKQLRLATGAPRRLRFDRRGAAFTLRLKHDELFQLSPSDIGVGGGSLAEADVPELVSSTSPDWPENAIVGPLLDLQSAGQRRLRGRVGGTAGARVEVLLESFPEDLGFPAGIECEGCSVIRHQRRPGAVWIKGGAPLEFLLPPRSPADRLGVLLKVDGQRISSSRMRYLERVLSAPDTLELGFSAGAWLQPELRAPMAEGQNARIRIDLLDELPLRADLELPSPAELEYLRKLDPDE